MYQAKPSLDAPSLCKEMHKKMRKNVQNLPERRKKYENAKITQNMQKNGKNDKMSFLKKWTKNSSNSKIAKNWGNKHHA